MTYKRLFALLLAVLLITSCIPTAYAAKNTPAPFLSVSYVLENETDGFANGTVTVTKASNNPATDCLLYWADENGAPLEGYSSLAKFKLTGDITVQEMYPHTIIPEGAKTLVAYSCQGGVVSEEAALTTLPNGCNYVFDSECLMEFQIGSDTHVTVDQNHIHNRHFAAMLEDIRTNSPDSAGIFINGDSTDHGMIAEQENLLALYNAAAEKGLKAKIHLILGNHDYYDGDPRPKFQNFAFALNDTLGKAPESIYYRERINGFDFIYMGGEDYGDYAFLSTAQFDWLEENLAQVTQENPGKPIFVFLHQSFFNTIAGTLPDQRWHGIYETQDAALRQIFQKYPQIIMFGGHTHWDMNTPNNIYPGDESAPVLLNTSSVGYLWSSYDVPDGVHLEGSQGYYARVYEDKVLFLGRDFVKGEFIPSAMFLVQPNTIHTQKDTYQMGIGETLTLDACTPDPVNATWSSSNNYVAEVTTLGEVIGNRHGTVQISIYAHGTNTAVVDRKTVTVQVHNWDNGVCKNCGAVRHTCADQDGNGLCDKCSATLNCKDKNGDHCCDICTAPIADPNVPVQDIFRLFGKNRQQTAFIVADELKNSLGIEKFESIVIASGTDFADALSGSYLAAVKNAPILLTQNKDSQIQKTAEYIQQNLASGGTVYILGGEAAVSKSMETALAGLTVQRVAGKDRYSTNLEILKTAGVPAGKEVLVCTGKEYADALSASATGMPILLVKGKLTDAQQAYVKTLSQPTWSIIGGTTAVPDSTAKALESFGTVRRFAGKDRLETSLLVAQAYFETAGAAVLAYSENFPDGLCGGRLAHALNIPLILTHFKESRYTFTSRYTAQAGITAGYILGGSALVSDEAALAVFHASEGTPITQLK